MRTLFRNAPITWYFNKIHRATDFYKEVLFFLSSEGKFTARWGSKRLMEFNFSKLRSLAPFFFDFTLINESLSGSLWSFLRKTSPQRNLNNSLCAKRTFIKVGYFKQTLILSLIKSSAQKDERNPNWNEIKT